MSALLAERSVRGMLAELKLHPIALAMQAWKKLGAPALPDTALTWISAD